MQTHDGLLKRRVLPTLLGITLLGCVAAAPAFAQSDRDYNKHHNTAKDDDGMMFDPAPMSYPQAAPGGLHLYHWKDYTQRKMEPGSVSDKHWEMDHKREKKRREQAAYYHRTREMEPMSESTSAGWSENNEWKDMDQKVAAGDNMGSFWSASPWNWENNSSIVFWPSQSNIADGNGYVYVLRGDTIYQMRVNDFAPTAQNTLPWLNNQTGYDLPTTQIEDVDVYNKLETENIPPMNEETTPNPDQIPTDFDYPQGVTPPDDRSDLNGNAYYHRSSTATGPANMMSATIAVSGDYVYVLRGNILYQLRITDLSLVNQKELPIPATSGNP